jgi:peptidyl-prolyl cis-trans isomerase B (cyclophilin B)
MSTGLRRARQVPGNNERQRRQARERYLRQQEERRTRRHRARRRLLTGITALAAVGLIAGLLVAFLPGGGGKKAAPKSSTSASASASASASTVAEPAHKCTYTSATPVAKKESFPPSAPDYTASYTATIKTNLGSINLNLLNSKATCTVNSFVHLAEAGYFSNTQCHRVVTSGIFVLQCGDAYATSSTKLTCSDTSNVGSGTPGYNFASENLTKATYPAGTVAMANEGTATTNGSQFFIVYQDSTAELNSSSGPSYTPFATVSSGLDIVQNVAKDGTSCTYSAGGGVPKEKVIIDSVTIKKA